MSKYVEAFYNGRNGRKKLRIRVDGFAKKEEKRQGQAFGMDGVIALGGAASGDGAVIRMGGNSANFGGGYIGAPVFGAINIPQEPDIKAKDSGDDDELIFKEIERLRANAIQLPEMVKLEKEPEPTEDDVKIINVKYPLIPNKPARGERVYAYAHIFFDRRYNELIYNVVEPPLSGPDKALLDSIKEYIQDKLNISFSQIRKGEASSYVSEIFDKATKYFKIKDNIDVLRYYILRDFIGLEMLEPFLQDRNIEDISCDGAGIPIYIYHRDARIGSVRTNIQFNDKDDLDSFVSKIAERTGKTITVAKPLLDSSLPDGSRVQVTLGSDIARHGSNFTIRMFTERPLTPVDMIKSGTTDLRMMAYIWYIIEHEASVLISGGTASGKTSLLNVLSLFIKPQLKIVSIEDTAELRLPHAHWVPEVARTVISETGQVDMFELLRESLRQRPDYIIVGEVRGHEAYVLFQQIATGHAGLATIHADNFAKLLDRLTTQPIGLPPNLIQNLDSIIFVKRVKRGRRYMRKTSQVTEIVGFDRRKDRPVVGEVFKWDPVKDEYPMVGKSVVLRRIANNTGISEAEIVQEIENRAKVLKWMVSKNMKDYRNVSSVINLYYLSPDFVMKKIGAPEK